VSFVCLFVTRLACKHYRQKHIKTESQTTTPPRRTPCTSLGPIAGTRTSREGIDHRAPRVYRGKEARYPWVSHHRLPSSRSTKEQSPREGQSATFASDATHSNHGTTRSPAASAQNEWMMRAESGAPEFVVG
jgi:hypothetical protein